MSSLAERSARGRQVLALGVGINVFLAAVKLVTGWLGHSDALIADGLESTLDVLSSSLIWGALLYAERPPDEQHPYGHGKMESLAGIAGALLLLIAGMLVAWNSLREIFAADAVRTSPAPFTLGVLILVIFLKETMFRLALNRGTEVGSSALKSDAWHHRSDALTSAAAAIGISAALLGGPAWVVADDWAALFSCGIIAFNGARMLRSSLGEILDEQAPVAVIAAIEQAAREVPGVENVEKCRVRKSGLTLIADLHVRVDGAVSVADGHRIAHHVKDALIGERYRLSDVTVHIEPA